MVIEIPEQLKKESFRFTRLKGKVPIDKNWQKDNNFKYYDKQLLNHNNNIGVCCGKGNLFVVDIDGNGEETLNKLLGKLPPTYVVKTGKQGYHMFYISDELISTTSFDFNNSHIDIKADRGQVVMEGSIHPDTNKKYIAHTQDVITNITKAEFEKVFELKQNNGITIKEKNNINADDGSRSAKEYQQICSMLAKGKSKEEIFSFMFAFDKWKNSDDRYKEYTYNKALNFIESSKSDPVNDNNIKYKVFELLCDNDKTTRKQSRLDAEEILVNYLINKFNFKTILQDEKLEVWGYKDGVYLPIGQSMAREELRKILGRAFNQIMVQNIITKLTADTYIDPKEFFEQEDPYLLPVQNGLLDLKTLELKPFDPNRVFFSKMPMAYNPDAKCPHILKHLNSVLPEEKDVYLLQEAIGNCLLKKYTFQKAVMCVGGGRNGKGITLQLITRFLGPNNCSAIPLEDIENDPYSISNLHGKLANIGGDLNKNSLKNTGNFKTVSGGDLYSARRKFLTNLAFENYAKFFFACNDLPIVYDDSTGFWERWLYFEFPFTFIKLEEYELKPDEEKDKYKIADPLIKEKLFNESELEGMLTFAIEGLKRLLDNNGFSTSETSDAIRERWSNQSDSFKAFCNKYIETDYNSEIEKTELKQKYHEHCKKQDVKMLSEKHIYKILTEDFGAEIKQRRLMEDTKRVWTGVRFK